MDSDLQNAVSRCIRLLGPQALQYFYNWWTSRRFAIGPYEILFTWMKAYNTVLDSGDNGAVIVLMAHVRKRNTFCFIGEYRVEILTDGTDSRLPAWFHTHPGCYIHPSLGPPTLATTGFQERLPALWMRYTHV